MMRRREFIAAVGSVAVARPSSGIAQQVRRAKAPALTVPPALLARADEVIE